MFNWIKEWYELKREFKVCESCETLKQQLAIANIEKSQLLTRLLEKPEPEVRTIQSEEPKIITPHMPWAARRQMIEAEDRERAKLLRDAPKPTMVSKTEDLEREILSATESEEVTSKS